MSSNGFLKVGQEVFLTGCFTEEYFLRGFTVSQIGRELGLPRHRLENGIFIAFAIEPPALHEFYLGGWAEYPVDTFVNYNKEKIQWSETHYEKTFKDKRFPVSIAEAKKGYMKDFKHIKLIKVIPNIPHQSNDVYPSGGKASQIVVTHPIRCQVTNYLKGDEVFHKVW